jgi:ADP-dependent NAD(P)H-hydrate dehydratase / NAD(P)H-hydrate epimerase
MPAYRLTPKSDYTRPAAFDRHAVLTTAEMAEADRLAIAGGHSGIALMEAAGARATAAIMRRWSARPVAVLCGPGNNGGDGFVVGRLLQAQGWPVTLIRLGERTGMRGDAAKAAATWRGPELPPEPASLDGTALVVDALFGAGLDRPLDGAARRLIEAVATRGLDCAAIDMPSGISGDTGAVLGVAARCRVTATFFRPKPGHFLEPGRSHCGVLDVAEIGIPASVLAQIAPNLALNAPGLWLERFPFPAAADHKYTRGHAIVLGGATMTGAARLAANAARRLGSGLLTIASPPEAFPIYAAGEPGAIARPVADDEAFERLVSDPRVTAVLVGPGAGLDDMVRRRCLIARAAKKPCLFDADALTLFADMPDTLFSRLDAHCLLTPHEGEFGRLFPDLTGDRLNRALTAARRSGAIVLFKGADTVIAAPDGTAILSPLGPPTLATGGSGDVLAGLALGLIAQGMAPLWAAAAACWFQAEAARSHGPGLIAEDLASAVPGLLQALARLTGRPI